MYNFSEFTPTFNKAIDLCANIIGCARDNGTPIKSLSLQPLHFEWFKGGVKQLMEQNGASPEMIANVDGDQMLQFDGVNIEKGSRLQTKAVIIEYYANVN